MLFKYIQQHTIVVSIRFKRSRGSIATYTVLQFKQRKDYSKILLYVYNHLIALFNMINFEMAIPLIIGYYYFRSK